MIKATIHPDINSNTLSPSLLLPNSASILLSKNIIATNAFASFTPKVATITGDLSIP